MSLTPILEAAIKQKGSISVAEYMSLCLGHEEFGYYKRKDPFGAAGDFTTAPEISQIFGEMLGLWCAHLWALMGKPTRFAMAEIGPGRGTLMADMLRAAKVQPGFLDAATIHMVETSPRLRAEQEKKLAEIKRPKFWHESAAELPNQPTILVANEFLDALPIHQYVLENGQETERHVTLNDAGELCFTPTGEVVREACPAALDVIKDLSAHLLQNSGAALFIDYGYVRGSTGDTLQAVLAHQYHDVLQNPGEADLTAHVDFQTLAVAAKKQGARVAGPVAQGIFLERLGAEVRMQQLMNAASESQRQGILSGYQRLVMPDDMGSLFKVLALTSEDFPSLPGFQSQVVS